MKATPETATGLRVDIVIECETEDEIFSHLHAISEHLRKLLASRGNEITDTLQWDDSNCYGNHTVIINLDK